MRRKTMLIILKKPFIAMVVFALMLTMGLCKMSATVLARKAYFPLGGKKIVIDPGHGGVDSGANDNGFKEKDVNLQIALELRNILTLAGAEVVMTRTDDTDVTEKGDPGLRRYQRDLDGRVNVMNENKADLFISLHVNSCQGANRTRGGFVFYRKGSSDGELLAECIQERVNGYVKRFTSDGELGQHHSRPANYYLLKNAGVPAALVEMGFMTHREERRLLMDPAYQRGLAQVVAAGVRDFFVNVSTK